MEYDVRKFKNIDQWYQRMKKEIPMYKEINEEGVKEFKEMVASLRK